MKKTKSPQTRRPRVPGGFCKVVTAKLSESQYARLEAVGQERGLPLSVLIREIVVKFLATYTYVPSHRENMGIRGRRETSYDESSGLGRRRLLRG